VLSVVVPPVQKDVPLEETITGAGGELMISVFEDDPVHPFEPVTVTVYVPAIVTGIVEVVAPVDHK
jgi:hypothetical protein